MSRLTIDITDQQHQSPKALAALQGKTIKQYALERLFPGDADADQAWQELKTCWEIASTMALRGGFPPRASVKSWMKNSPGTALDSLYPHARGRSRSARHHPLHVSSGAIRSSAAMSPSWNKELPALPPDKALSKT